MFEVAALFPLFPGSNEVSGNRMMLLLCCCPWWPGTVRRRSSPGTCLIQLLGCCWQNDQIDRIHKIMGTPSTEVCWWFVCFMFEYISPPRWVQLLAKFKISETHTDVKFPQYVTAPCTPHHGPSCSLPPSWHLRYTGNGVVQLLPRVSPVRTCFFCLFFL